ncbi:MAG: YihY/virulence factor BrkB family protein [Clostridia bacterium]|nr:YihY/virulence factor BrkB family protein [Clostridia bacterium]
MAHNFSGIGKKIKTLWNEFFEGDFLGLSAEMSFYLLSTFLPMIIFVFTIASSISQNYTDAMLDAISVLPDKVSKLLIKMLVSRTRSNAVIIMTGAFSLFTMSGFVLSAEKGLNRFYKLKNERGFFKSNGLAVIFAFFIFLSIIASFALIIFGGVISDRLFAMPSLSKLLPLWNTSRHIIILIFIAFVISALFKALPTVKLKLWQVMPGALFTTIGWYITSMLFALYVNNFPQYEIIYGSLAGFACMVMWIYITGIVILIGAKINAMIYLHIQRKKENPDATSNKPDIKETISEN